MVSTRSSMICVARRFSRAICMVKNPLVKPENRVATVVPTMPMPTVASTSENAASFWRSFLISDALIFITPFSEILLRDSSHVLRSHLLPVRHNVPALPTIAETLVVVQGEAACRLHALG